MRLGCTLAICALSLGCGKRFDAVPGSDARLRAHECLWTPSGQTYRIASAGPVFRGAGQSIGVLVSYLSEPLPAAQLERDAKVLVTAFGPEMLLAGEKKLTVEARNPESGSPTSASRVVFEPRHGSWERQPDQPPPASPDAAIAATGAAAPDTCAEVIVKIKAAGEVASRWVRLLDGGADAALQQMSAEFRSQVEASPERWRQVLDERENLGVGARRVELYRMQTRNRNHALRAGDTVLIEYASQPIAARRVLERVVLVNDPAGWRIDGYVFQPLPES